MCLVNLIEEYASERGTLRAVSDNAATHFFGEELCEEDSADYLEDAFKTSFCGYEGACAVLCAALLFYISDNSICKSISGRFKNYDLKLCLKVMYILSRRFFSGANFKVFAGNSFFKRNLLKIACPQNQENSPEDELLCSAEEEVAKKTETFEDVMKAFLLSHRAKMHERKSGDWSVSSDRDRASISLVSEMDRLVFGDSPVIRFLDSVDSVRELIERKATNPEIRDCLFSISLKLKNESPDLRHSASRDDLRALRISRDLLLMEFVFDRGLFEDEANTFTKVAERLAGGEYLKGVRVLPYVKKYICLAMLHRNSSMYNSLCDRRYLSRVSESSGNSSFEAYLKSLDLNTLYFEDPKTVEMVLAKGEQSAADYICSSLNNLCSCNRKVTDLLRHETGLENYCSFELEDYIIKNPEYHGYDDGFIHYDEEKIANDNRLKIKKAVSELAALLRADFMPYDALTSLPYVKLVSFMMERGFTSQEIDLPLKSCKRKAFRTYSQGNGKSSAPFEYEKSFAFIFGGRKLPDGYLNQKLKKIDNLTLKLMKSKEKSASLKKFCLEKSFYDILGEAERGVFYDFSEDQFLIADVIEAYINKIENYQHFTTGLKTRYARAFGDKKIFEGSKKKLFDQIYTSIDRFVERLFRCLYLGMRTEYSVMDFGHFRDLLLEKRRICDLYMRNQRMLSFICLNEKDDDMKKTLFPLPKECLKIALILNEAQNILENRIQPDPNSKCSSRVFQNEYMLHLVEQLPEFSGKEFLLKVLRDRIDGYLRDLSKNLYPGHDVPLSFKRLFWQLKLNEVNSDLQLEELNKEYPEIRQRNLVLRKEFFALTETLKYKLWHLNRYGDLDDDSSDASVSPFGVLLSGSYDKILSVCSPFLRDRTFPFYSSMNQDELKLLSEHCKNAADDLLQSEPLSIYSKFVSRINPTASYCKKSEPSKAGKVLSRMERRLRERGIKAEITPAVKSIDPNKENALIKIAGNRKLTEFLNGNYVLPYRENRKDPEKLRENFFSKFLLISGESGTGKTYAVNALAEKLNLKVKRYDVTALTSSLVHGGNGMFRRIIDEIISSEPVVALFENFEEILRDRRYLKADNEWTGEEISAFSVCMDKLREHNILLVMTVTDRMLLDSGISDKFSCEIELTDPDDKDIRDLLDEELPSDSFSKSQKAYLLNGLKGRSIRQIVKFLGKLKKTMEDNGLAKADYSLIDDELNKFDGLNLHPDAVFRLTGQKDFEKFINANLVNYAKYPASYRRYNSKPTEPVLLYGPPGTGKTYAVKALSDFIKWKMYTVDASQFGAMTDGSARKVNEVFKKTRETAPSIIVIDEADAFFRKREFGSNTEMISEFLRSINNTARDRVLVIATTNLVDNIDEAILRNGRFTNLIKIGYTTKDSAFEVLKKGFSEVPVSEDIHLENMSELLAGRPVCDVQAVVEKSCNLAAFKNAPYITDEIIKEAFSKVKDSRTGNNTTRRIGFI